MAEAGVFRTDDLGLSVLLSCHGFSYEVAKFTETRVRWTFDYSADDEKRFDEIVGDYQELCATVEPRKFMNRWAEMRNEFLALVPARASTRRRPVAPA